MDMFTDRALSVLDAHPESASKPFFMYLAFHRFAENFCMRMQ